MPSFLLEILNCTCSTETLDMSWRNGQLTQGEKALRKEGRDGKIWQEKLNQCFHKIIYKADMIY
jgi:hypothetical protein